jgi:hypothetical protein
LKNPLIFGDNLKSISENLLSDPKFSIINVNDSSLRQIHINYVKIATHILGCPPLRILANEYSSDFSYDDNLSDDEIKSLLIKLLRSL